MREERDGGKLGRRMEKVGIHQVRVRYGREGERTDGGHEAERGREEVEERGGRGRGETCSIEGTRQRVVSERLDTGHAAAGK